MSYLQENCRCSERNLISVDIMIQTHKIKFSNLTSKLRKQNCFVEKFAFDSETNFYQAISTK